MSQKTIPNLHHLYKKQLQMPLITKTYPHLAYKVECPISEQT